MDLHLRTLAADFQNNPWQYFHERELHARFFELSREASGRATVALSAESETSCLVGRNSGHARCRFMPGHHLKLGVGSAEGIRFVIRKKPHFPRLFVDDPYAQVVGVPSHFLLKAGDLSRIARCVVPHTANPQSAPPTK